MADIKISELPIVSSVSSTDILPIVAGSITSQIKVQNLASSLTQVTSSISASYAFTASYALNAISINTSNFVTTGSSNIEQSITGSLIVTGSFLARGGVSLGTNITNLHYITGSVYSTGSFTQNGFTILTQVSKSLNFADDTAAAAGGVPLGGLYRNGNVIAIRIA